MKIKQITMTEQELKEAVKSWLFKRGLDVEIDSVEKNYTSGGGYVIGAEPISEAPLPRIESPEQLGQALEEGKV